MPDMPGADQAQDPSQDQQDPAQESGAITKLAQQVGDGLMKLSDALNNSPAATDQDREQMAQVLNGFIDLVEKKLGGSAPGEDSPDDQELVDSGVPTAAGPKGVPMGPNTRM
jgi:hypothetical protein